MINLKDGTDYWLGGMDIDRDKGLHWLTGDTICQSASSLSRTPSFLSASHDVHLSKAPPWSSPTSRITKSRQDSPSFTWTLTMDSSMSLFCELFLNSFSFVGYFLAQNFLFVNHSFCSATRSWLYSKVGHEGRCQRPGQRLCLQEENLTNKMDRAPKFYLWTIFILQIKTTPSWT